MSDRLLYHYNKLYEKFKHSPEVVVLLVEDKDYNMLVVNFRSSKFRVIVSHGFAPSILKYNMYKRPEVGREKRSYSVDNLVRDMRSDLSRRLRAEGVVV